MAPQLRVSVQLLSRTFHGRGDDDTREWPPSPFRLFQAMLAGCRLGLARRSWTDGRRTAFEWMERRDPPIIIAPEARAATGFSTAVPNNDLDLVAKEWVRGKFDPNAAAALKTIKTYRPQVISEDVDPTVHYVWRLSAASDVKHAEEMSRSCRHLVALGLGIDLAAANAVLEDADGARIVGTLYAPSRSGGAPLRVAAPGSLGSLDRRHDAFVRRIQGRTIDLAVAAPVYQLCHYVTGTSLQRPFSCFHIVDERGRLKLASQRAIHVQSGVVRHAAIRAATLDARAERWSSSFVAGHGVDDEKANRFAYLPLPSIGRHHADGELRRVIVAGPIGGERGDVEWAGTRLDGAVLIDEATGEVRGLLVRQAAADGVTRLYTGRATRWTTVTPVVLPGHDDRRRGKTDSLFARALEQAGLGDSVVSFGLRRGPFWAGSRHSADYDVPPYLRGFGRWHAEVTFREPISGPVTIGAGRHVGLGLFAVADW